MTEFRRPPVAAQRPLWSLEATVVGMQALPERLLEYVLCVRAVHVADLSRSLSRSLSLSTAATGDYRYCKNNQTEHILQKVKV